MPETQGRHGAGDPPLPERLWRSVEAAAGAPLATLAKEVEEVLAAGQDRRTVLKLMAASLGLAGLAACSPPPEDEVVPSVRDHEGRSPGERQRFATLLTLEGLARGVLATSLMGRPIKLEGNPLHPSSLGASDAFVQAEILTLYDPERSGSVREARAPSSFARLEQALALERERLVAAGGRGLHLVTEPFTSPSLASLLDRLLTALPEARWHVMAPLDPGAAFQGARAAFGQLVEPVHALERADVVLDLDADLLGPGPRQIVHGRGFAVRRDPATEGGMSRLYALETTPGLSGAAADHRAALTPAEIEAFVRGLLHALGLGPEAPTPPVPWFPALVRDLDAHRGRVLVAAGPGQPPFVQAAAHALNVELGAVDGGTVRYIEPLHHRAEHQEPSLEPLAQALAADRVETLVVLGANPAYHAPADLEVATLMRRARFSLHHGLYADETAAECLWHAPLAHELESWGDALAHDGTLGLRQPLIRPLRGGRSAESVLALLAGERGDDHARLRAFWRGRWDDEGAFDDAWRAALHDGVVAGTEAPSVEVTLRDDWQGAPGLPADGGGLALLFRPDPSVWDGRFAANAWLQELPKPLTKLTWDNAALIAPAMAMRLGLENGSVIRLARAGREVEAPVWIAAGHAENCVTLPLGYGRAQAGTVGSGRGFDANRLRSRDALWVAFDLVLEPTGTRMRLASTQEHHALEGRDVIRRGTLAAWLADPALGGEPQAPPSLYPEPQRPGQAWGMVIDLNACTGCNACVVACQAENNTAVVGKSQVLRGRELHWLRIDRYHEGPVADPRTHFQPVLCMQCELAPCEVVCPVNATVHSSEGLNDMVYARCIGTRYCSNNCPYKVRRFNWLDYASGPHPRPRAANNPDVTVRTRGVMEKCTYCTHRISAARTEARREGRAVRDGEMLTACQQACPTQAINFGDLRQADSEVAGRRADPRNYALLGDLGTRPRTTYLAKVTNPAAEDG